MEVAVDEDAGAGKQPVDDLLHGGLDPGAAVAGGGRVPVDHHGRKVRHQRRIVGQVGGVVAVQLGQRFAGGGVEGGLVLRPVRALGGEQAVAQVLQQQEARVGRGGEDGGGGEAAGGEPAADRDEAAHVLARSRAARPSGWRTRPRVQGGRSGARRRRRRSGWRRAPPQPASFRKSSRRSSGRRSGRGRAVMRVAPRRPAPAGPAGAPGRRAWRRGRRPARARASGQRLRGPVGAEPVGPFDQAERVVEGRVEAELQHLRRIGEAVEVGVPDLERPGVVGLDQREGGRGARPRAAGRRGRAGRRRGPARRPSCPRPPALRAGACTPARRGRRGPARAPRWRRVRAATA